MVEMLGKDYIIDHVIIEHKDRDEREAYSFFVSEMLRALNNSVAKNFGGSVFDKSFEQLKHYKPETRTGEEVKNHVLNKVKELKERWEENGTDIG